MRLTEYLPDIDDLVVATQGATKPLVLLVGSAVSSDPGDPAHGVPNVAGMLGLVREAAVRFRLNRSKLDAELAGKEGAEAYQVAIAFLQAQAGQDEVNRVVRQAVLHAHRCPSSVDASNPRTDGDPADWYLPRATDLLGQWLTQQPPDRVSAVLTTNFDPLIGLAVKSHGGRVRRVVLDADGRLGRDVEFQEGVLKVVHLHGYWRGSDTLHTPGQLTGRRPYLNAALQRLLSRHVLVVIGYGGWNDAFTRALEDLLHDDEAGVDIRWGFYESNRSLIEARYSLLFSRVQPAISRGRFVPYGRVDCHQFFERLVSEASRAEITVEATRSPVDGWVVVDHQYLGGQQGPLTTSELRAYFDGQVPTWRHAISASIPRREVVQATLRSLDDWHARDGSNLLVLLLGAAGEGKSTATLQIAASIAQRPTDWMVLWRPTADTLLDPKQLENLDTSKRSLLLVTDDADRIVGELYEAARVLHSGGRTNVCILACARDTDWQHAGGSRMSWGLYLECPDPIRMRGITAGDALQVVQAWGDPAVDALGELRQLPDAASRAAALEKAARQEGSKPEGSFFGGLLRARYGATGLLAHVTEMIGRLRSRPVGRSGKALADAFLYVAACHATVGPLDRRILADLMGLPYDRLGTLLERPLGEEAASVRAGLALWTRHRAVARAAVQVASGALDVSLADLYVDIVRQAIATRNRLGLKPENYDALLHCGPRLANQLPSDIESDVRQEAAIFAARTAAELMPGHIGPVVDYSVTLRKAGQRGQALEVLEAGWLTIRDAEDYQQYARRYCSEWGTTRRSVRDPAGNVWMQLVSMSDYLNAAPMKARELEISCVALIGGLRELANREAGPELITRANPALEQAAAAAERIREMVEAGATKQGQAAASSKTCADRHSDVGAAVRSLYQAGGIASQRTTAESVPFVSESKQLRFQALESFLCDHS